MKMYLEKVDFKDTSIPFVGAVIGEPLEKGESSRAALMQHIHAPTRWYKVMQTFADCDVIIEVGPGTHLQKAFREIYPDKKVYGILVPQDIEQLKAEIL